MTTISFFCLFALPSSDIPRVLCVVPNGDNPSGAGLSLERKKEIYAIAQKYNMIIMEDDPYFFIQFNKVRGHDIYVCTLIDFTQMHL